MAKKKVKKSRAATGAKASPKKTVKKKAKRPAKGGASPKKTAKKAKSAESAPAETPARKRVARPKHATSTDLRNRLRDLDREIIRVLQDRAKLVEKISGRDDPVAEASVAAALRDDSLVQLISSSRGPLSERTLRSIFRELLSGCRSLVHQQRIAFLGPDFSFSHLAALHHFGQSVEFEQVGSIPAVFEEVSRKHSDFGLVPVENSTDGRIADTLDMFAKSSVRICAQLEMAIHHTLLGKCPRREVKEVYSKPQALSQCRNWLAKHLPEARSIEVTSTSTAAKLAKDKPGTAAIASLEAGIHHGLDVLAENIEDNTSNTTRFVVIGEYAAERTGQDCTAMLFQVAHRPGALADAMNVFKRNDVNLTWIESFPIPNSDRAYLFFAEMEGHETDAHINRTVTALKKRTLRFEVLGSFPALEDD